MNKKVGVWVFLFVVMFLCSISFSSAAFIDSVKQAGNGLIDVITSLTSTLFGIQPSGGNIFETRDLLATVLFFVIVLAVVWTVMDKIPLFQDYTWVMVTVSILTAFLSTRFLSSDLIQTMLLPYSTLGIAISLLVPFIFYFIFVEQALNSSVFRKIAWIFAAVIFTGLYFARMDEMIGALWLYPVAIGLCIIFMLFDRTIQNAWKKAQAEGRMAVGQAQIRANLTQQRYDLEQKRLNNAITIADYNILDKALKKNEKKYGI